MSTSTAMNRLPTPIALSRRRSVTLSLSDAGPPTSHSNQVASSSASFHASLPGHDSSDSASTRSETPPSTPPCLEGCFALPGVMYGPGGKRRMLRRNSSLSSLSSSVASNEESEEGEWTESDRATLKQAFETYCSQIQVTQTPFQLNAPPFHIPHVVAKGLVSRRGARPSRTGGRSRSSSRGSIGSESVVDEQPVWKHGLRSTRAQLAHMIKDQQLKLVEATPRQDATPRMVAPGLQRQGSMDFLPSGRNAAIVARLGSKLHRAEQNAPSISHPYARPTSTRLHRAASLSTLSTITGSPSQPTPVASARMQRIASDTRSLRPFYTGYEPNFDYGYNHDSLDYPPPPSTTELSPSGTMLTIPTNCSATHGSASGLSSPFDLRPKSSKNGFSKAFADSLDHGRSYPSPQSNKKRSDRPASSPGNESERPPPIVLGNPFGDEGASSSAVSSRTRRSTNANKGFYLGDGGGGSTNGVSEGDGYDDDDSMSCFSLGSGSDVYSQFSATDTDYSRPSASSFFASQQAAASSDTISMMSVTTPLSESFDLKELSLAEELEGRECRFGEKDEEEREANFDRDARLMRSRLEGWQGWQGN